MISATKETLNFSRERNDQDFILLHYSKMGKLWNKSYLIGLVLSLFLRRSRSAACCISGKSDYSSHLPLVRLLYNIIHSYMRVVEFTIKFHKSHIICENLVQQKMILRCIVDTSLTFLHQYIYHPSVVELIILS